MLNTIIKYSLNNRLVILIGAVLLLFGGTYVSSKMEVDVFPDLNAPTVVILTESYGMAPEEVEKLVSFPIETAINGATGIRRVRSSSTMGLSIVWAEFDWDMNVYNARQIVSEKLMMIGDQLPIGVSKPVLAPQSSIMGEIMIFSLTADSTSALDLRTLAEWTVRPYLLSVGGVAQTTIIGGQNKEYQILADPFKMKHYDVSINDLITACTESNKNAIGGFIEEYSQKYLIRGIIRSSDTLELANSLIKMRGEYPVRIRDVANVTVGGAPKIGDGYYSGQKAVVITVTKQPNINTIELTEKIKEALTEINKTFPPDVKIHTDIFDQAQFINISINNVKNALLEGAIFVVIILFVFLMNWRTTIISLLAIPLSLLVTIIFLWGFGFSINTMTLGGMAISIGSLVDDAIIDVENVYKRLRQNNQLPANERVNSVKVIFDASVEIRASIINATLIIIVAFVPLFFLSGMEGRMLKPLGIAYIVSLFASLLVAVTLTPVLCRFWLTNEKQLQKHKKGSWTEQKLNSIYSKILNVVLAKSRLTIITIGVLFVLSLLLMFTFGRNFLPPFNEGALTINVATMPGTSLNESNIIGQRAEEALLSIPEITTTSRRTGRAEFAEHAFDVNTSEIDVPFNLGDRSQSEFMKAVRQKLNSIEGVIVEVGQPISHRIDAMLSGSKANIAVKLFGTDLNKMYQLANQMKTSFEKVEGIGDLSVEQQIEIPEIHIKPKREMLAKYGIPINKFTEFINCAFGGIKISDVFEMEKQYELTLRFNDEHRNTIEAIREAYIDSNKGKIPLHVVADVFSYSGPNTINRENVKRKLVISVNVADRDVRSVVNDLKKIVAKIDFPENYNVDYGGQFESEEEASRILLITTLLAIMIIFLILYQEFKNVKLASVILVNLPLALIGGIIAIKITSATLSIPAIIGFITLFGIATRNGILLISRYQSLKQENMPLLEIIKTGSVDRLNPIFMTALTAALALIPLAINGHKPGNEIQSPMAVVILGGLISSTILNIFIIPALYYLMNKNKSRPLSVKKT